MSRPEIRDRKIELLSRLDKILKWKYSWVSNGERKPVTTIKDIDDDTIDGFKLSTDELPLVHCGAQGVERFTLTTKGLYIGREKRSDRFIAFDEIDKLEDKKDYIPSLNVELQFLSFHLVLKSGERVKFLVEYGTPMRAILPLLLWCIDSE